MRKILALILAVLTISSCVIVASATGYEQELTLEIEYPEAHYVINIPDNITVSAITGAQDIGVPTIVNEGTGDLEDYGTTGFVGNRYLSCVITSANGFNMKNGDIGIPYTMIASGLTEDEEATKTFGADETVSCFFANNGEGGLNEYPSHADVDGITAFQIQFVEDDLADKYGTFTDRLTYTLEVKDNWD